MKNTQDFFTLYKQSAWNKDTENMISLYDDRVMIFDMWMKGYQTGLADWSIVIKNWLGSLGDERVKVEFEMIEVHENGNVGFGSALISYQAISINNEVLRSMKNRITLGFVKDEDEWRVRHQHTSAPIDAELKAILNL